MSMTIVRNERGFTLAELMVATLITTMTRPNGTTSATADPDTTRRSGHDVGTPFGRHRASAADQPSRHTVINLSGGVSLRQWRRQRDVLEATRQAVHPPATLPGPVDHGIGATAPPRSPSSCPAIAMRGQGRTVDRSGRRTPSLPSRL